MVSDRDVTRDGGVVGKNGFVADFAIVGDVGVAQKEVMIPDLGGAFGSGTAVDGHVFAKGIVVTDDELGLLPLVFKILCAPSESREGKDEAALANDGIAFDNNVAAEFGVVTEDDIVANDTVGTNLTIGADFCFGRDDGSRMNSHGKGI